MTAYMSPIINEVFHKALAAEDAHPIRTRFRWRIGHDAYMMIVEASAPSRGNHDLDIYGDRFRRLVDKQDEWHRDWIKAGHDAWGKEGSTLLGWPVVCDETFEGIEAEVIEEVRCTACGAPKE